MARGNLIVAMAPHVSRFITRLFGVGAEAESLVQATRAYDVLFRFKIDFVRRRALPLLKGGAHVTATAEDHALVEGALPGGRDFSPAHEFEMALAQFGCSLLDREATDKAAVADEIESLKRWCAAHVHDPRYRGWVVFRFPENLDYDHLVQIRRPDPALPEQMVGPDEKLRRREGFKLTDERYTQRESAERDPLLRALPRARQGHLLEGHSRQGRHGRHQPARHPAGRVPARREDLRDAHRAQARRRHRRAGHRRRRQPDVPGHRPSHLQRLHEGLHLPEAGAGQHPAD